MSAPADRVPAAGAARDRAPLRFVTAASLFDGHDAAINIMRRLIQAQGAEVIHLGHNRSVEDVVRAALQEDADGIALSSYQGGHMEYFRYMVDMLRERGAPHIRVFGGGGGTITPEEIAQLHAYGVERVYHPNDGMALGLVAMIEDLVRRTEAARSTRETRGQSTAFLATSTGATEAPAGKRYSDPGSVSEVALAGALSAIESGRIPEPELAALRRQWQLAGGRTPVIGLTGTGGAGKSSVTDELMNRFLAAFPRMRIAVISVDPTRRRTGGALLGDRIRMNALRSPRVFMRSMATRRQHVATNVVLKDCIAFLRAQGYDLVMVETAGIGQSDSEIVDLVDFPVYVMTSDYGAPSQLEKIDMLDFAELVVLNKFDKRGAEDALRDVRKQWKRNRTAFRLPDEEVPVYPTIASQFNDPGVTWMFVNLCRLLRGKLKLDDGGRCDWRPQVDTTLKEPRATVLIPGARVRYLAEIAEQGRASNARCESQAEIASRAHSYYETLRDLGDPELPAPLQAFPAAALLAGGSKTEPLSPTPLPQGERGSGGPVLEASDESAESATAVAGTPLPSRASGELATHASPPRAPAPEALAGTGGRGEGESGAQPDKTLLTLRQRYNAALDDLSPDSLGLLREWPARLKSVTDEVNEYEVRDRTIRVENYRGTLSHQKIPKIAPPRHRDWGDLLKFLGKENLPGHYPYTGGVYPYRREGEDPIRMFAGEGTPERTNRRFHYLSLGQPAARLSTAFDSVTLYGEDPHQRPDIYGKIGNSGVNVPTLDDMKKLYSGFDLCDPKTSVSMTINGPAPIILAMYMNTAIDQQVEKHLLEDRARWAKAEQAIETIYAGCPRPRYAGPLPQGNEGLGLALLGVSGDEVVDRETYERIKAATLRTVRGTVQADILKEDQAQNTCIFSTEFALRMMGDIQQYFVSNKVRNFYSVSISGYHIAEAGANPISQLAFTLSNGFTIVEYYLARGMKVDDFAPNLSFFFSNGMDPEYTVIGRVARRIWARAMKERYGASPRSQMLKYHVQTSGRSLHAQEIQFNDIRTTLQALYALFDHCNSLHTNAYDEAITTPTEESVRRAVAIQLIINRELGLNFCENPWQGSFVVEALTDLVEEAVYKEFEAISERGGVLGAMDTMYQRGKIQEESLHYEQLKHDGTLPLIGVNTFLPREHAGETATAIELIRSTEAEKQQQIRNVEAFRAARNARGSNPSPLVGEAGDVGVYADPPNARAGSAGRTEGQGRGRDLANVPGSLTHLQHTARARTNLFEALMEAVKYNSLGQISHALYEVGGEYRRNM